MFTNYEHHQYMNKPTETTLLHGAINALRGHGLAITELKPSRGRRGQAGAWVRVDKDGHHIDYTVEAKRTVARATVGAVVAQLHRDAEAAKRPLLLATQYVTPPIAETLRRLEQQFIDLAGNAYLNGPGILVYVTGRKVKELQGTPRPGRAFSAAGLKVVFALFCDPELAGAPYRAIAASAGVALGVVPPVFSDLRLQRYLYVGEKTRRLLTTKRFLDEWALVYARTLRTKTLVVTYVAPKFQTWRDWQLDPRQGRWGGEPAAALLTEYLRPGVLTIYAEKLPPRLAVEQRLVIAGKLTEERLFEVRRPFWGKALKTDVDAKTVPPVLVYADLLATGDARCIETAQMIYDQLLARRFPAG
jgi:hypothetical protein